MYDTTKVYVAASIVAVGIITKSAIRIHRVENLKRLEIERNLHLDLQAIKNSVAVMNDRIERGGIHSYQELVANVNNEIAFQKIAIREDN